METKKTKLPIIVLCILLAVLVIGAVIGITLHQGLVSDDIESTEAVSEETSETALEEVIVTTTSVTTTTTTNAATTTAPAPRPQETSESTTAAEIQEKKEIRSRSEKETATKGKSTIVGTSERDILARLLYEEGGSTSWDCQVYICSAALNLAEHLGRSITDVAFDKSLFSTANRLYRYSPTPTQYKVIDYVTSGGRIAGVKYFRTNHYHTFGTPVTCIDGVYFSK